MKLSFDIIVRSYEIDSYNHVNNAVYLNYLEHARMAFLNEINFEYKKMFDAGYMLYVTHVDISYKYSARLNDVLTIEVENIKLKKVSGVFHQRILNQDGIVCAEADVTWACVSKKTGRPTKLPDEFIVPGLIPDDSKD